MSNSAIAVTWSWLVVAIVFYGAMLHLTWLALKPKPKPIEGSDWFWGPTSVGWVQSIDVTKPRPSDPPESKPTSGAG